MKKNLDIYSELSRFHYAGQNYINLVAYLNCNCGSALIETIADTLAATTKYFFWNNFDSLCVSPDALKAEIAFEMSDTAEDFCEFSQKIPKNFLDAVMAEVWFNTLLIYYEFSSDVAAFLKNISLTILRHKDMFSENRVEEFVSLMLAEGMLDEVETFAEALDYVIVKVSPEELERFQDNVSENPINDCLKNYLSNLN